MACSDIATPVPVTQEAREVPTLSDLRRRMRALPANDPRWAAYNRGLNYYRDKAAIEAVEHNDRSPVEGGAMGARPKAGERFIEPKRRVPLDVQAGRVKVRRARPL